MFWWSFRRSPFNFIKKNEPNYRYIWINLSTSEERSRCFKVYLKEKSNNFEIQCILCYLRYLALLFQPLYLVSLSDWWSTFSKQNGESFPMRSIKKKGIHGSYRVNVHSAKCNAWYLKIIWKLQYQFPDDEIKWFTV